MRLEGLGTFRYTLKTNGVADEADFDFQKQVEAVRVQFVPQREGAVTKGGTASRELVPAGIEWLPYDAAASAGSNTQEPGTGEAPSDDFETLMTLMTMISIFYIRYKGGKCTIHYV